MTIKIKQGLICFRQLKSLNVWQIQTANDYQKPQYHIKYQYYPANKFYTNTAKMYLIKIETYSTNYLLLQSFDLFVSFIAMLRMFSLDDKKRNGTHETKYNLRVIKQTPLILILTYGKARSMHVRRKSCQIASIRMGTRIPRRNTF